MIDVEYSAISTRSIGFSRLGKHVPRLLLGLSEFGLGRYSHVVSRLNSHISMNVYSILVSSSPESRFINDIHSSEVYVLISAGLMS